MHSSPLSPPLDPSFLLSNWAGHILRAHAVPVSDLCLKQGNSASVPCAGSINTFLSLLVPPRRSGRGADWPMCLPTSWEIGTSLSQMGGVSQ